MRRSGEPLGGLTVARWLPPRRPDWSQRLAAYLDLCREEPWAWGQPRRDCCLFVTGAIEAQTGTNPAPWLAGTYDSAAGALRRTLELGGIERAISGVLGPPLARVAAARRGDACLVRLENGTTRLGVQYGDKIACKAAPVGVALVRPGAAIRAWRV